MYTDDSFPLIVGPDRVLRFIFVWHHVFCDDVTKEATRGPSPVDRNLVCLVLGDCVRLLGKKDEGL